MVVPVLHASVDLALVLDPYRPHTAPYHIRI
jgi:hypothetical protein